MQSAVAIPEDADPARTGRNSRILAVGLWMLGLVFWLGWLVYDWPVHTYLYPPGIPSTPLHVLDVALEILAGQGLTTIGLVIILRAGERRFGWLMLTAGFLASLVEFTAYYSIYALLVAPEADLPLGNLAAWVQNLWIIPWSLLYIYMPLLFPDGGLPSRHWRPVFRFITLFLGLVVLALAFLDAPLSNLYLDVETPVRNPYGIIPTDFLPPLLNQIIFVSAVFLVLAFLLAVLVSLVFRWRRAGGEVRQQIKWLFYPLGLLVALRATDWVLGGFITSIEYEYGFPLYLRQAQWFVVIMMELMLAFALLKYRLYDIDLIINRTLVYGALTAIVASGYVLVVTALGAILPAEGNLLPSLVATGVIAASFAPLREWLQRLINRLMFGERDDPYVVLSRLGQRLMTTPAPEATLHTITQTVATALKFPYVAIRLQQGDEFVTRAEYGTSAAEGIALDLVYQNEVVGQFVVAPRAPGERLTPRDRQLLEDIAHQASAVAHAVRLTSDLQRSRQRLVTAREEERRRLRRDLHDGLGPTLASHTLKLDTAMDLIHEQPDAAIEQLQDLYKQTQEIVADIRRLVHQLRPPALDDLGLVGAVQAHIQHSRRTGKRLHIAVDALPEELPPLPAAIELAAYRITMEAVTNAIRHARAEHCQVRFHLVNGLKRRLQIQISDNGQGLPRQLRHGVGITSMRERAQELGGWVRIEAGEGGGTLVCAELPLAEENVP